MSATDTTNENFEGPGQSGIMKTIWVLLALMFVGFAGFAYWAFSEGHFHKSSESLAVTRISDERAAREKAQEGHTQYGNIRVSTVPKGASVHLNGMQLHEFYKSIAKDGKLPELRTQSGAVVNMNDPEFEGIKTPATIQRISIEPDYKVELKLEYYLPYTVNLIKDNWTDQMGGGHTFLLADIMLMPDPANPPPTEEELEKMKAEEEKKAAKENKKKK
jgi:hypothetical protein